MKPSDHPGRELGFGIIGTGSIARTHARAIGAVPGIRLCAVSGRAPASASSFAAEFGVAAAASLETLLQRPDIDAICVATPTGEHGSVATRALAAGKHVLCEKPLEISTQRIDAMIACASRADRILAGVFQMRLGHGAQALKRAVEAGRFGRLALCSAYVKWWRDPDYYRRSSWKGTPELDGGGAVMNQAIHAVDLLQWLVGPPLAVTARIRTRTHPISTEDTAAALLEFPDGALGVIEAATSCFPGTALRIEIAGDHGSAVLENDQITKWEFAEPRDGDDLVRQGGPPLVNGGSSDPRAIGIEGHRRLIEDFAEAIRTRRPPMISCGEARHSVAIVEALYRSARSDETASPADVSGADAPFDTPAFPTFVPAGTPGAEMPSNTSRST